MPLIENEDIIINGPIPLEEYLKSNKEIKETNKQYEWDKDEYILDDRFVFKYDDNFIDDRLKREYEELMKQKDLLKE